MAVLKGAVLLFFLVLFSSVSFASSGFGIERVSVMDEERAVSVRLRNAGSDWIKVSAVVPELGVVSRRAPFRGSGSRVSVRLLLDGIPAGASGEYVVRVSASSDGVRRVRHRLITV